MRIQTRLGLLLTLALVLPMQAVAACSRVINVPMAATGLSVIADRNSISGGIYPDLLQSLQEKNQCSFAMQLVPRARLELMFKDGRADLLIPATRAPVRDAFGIFVPLIYNRATLISVKASRPLITSAAELLDQPALKVVLVRGFNYGAAYEALIEKLTLQGRVTYEPDPLAVARTLKLDSNWLTIMAPSILVGAIRNDARFSDLLKKLQYEPIKELPWGDSGAYVSKKSLAAADQKLLQSLLENAARSGSVWKGFQAYYGNDVMNEGVRPRSADGG